MLTLLGGVPAIVHSGGVRGGVGGLVSRGVIVGWCSRMGGPGQRVVEGAVAKTQSLPLSRRQEDGGEEEGTDASDGVGSHDGSHESLADLDGR